MNRSTVRFRLRLLSAFSLLVMLIVGGIGLFGIYSSNMSVSHVQKQVVTVNEINSLFHIVSTTIPDTMEKIYLEEIGAEEGVSRLHDIVDRSSELWDSIYHSETISNTALMERTNVEIKSLLMSVKKSSGLVSSGQLFEFGVHLNQDVNTRLDNLVSDLKEIIGQELETSDAQYTSARDTLQLSLMMIVASISLSGIILLFLFSSITGGISTAIRAISESASSIARGNLHERVPAHWTDEFSGLAEAFNDMTAELQDVYENLEQRVASRTRRLELIAMAGRQLNSIDTVSNAFETCSHTLRDGLDCARVAIYAPDPDGHRLILQQQASDSKSDLLGELDTIDLSMDHRVIHAARKGLHISQSDSGASRLYHLSAPIRRSPDGTLVAVIDATSLGEIDKGDTDLFNSITNLLSGAIARVESYQATEQSRREWESTFHAMRDGVALVDAELNPIIANSNFERILAGNEGEAREGEFHELLARSIAESRECNISPVVEYQAGDRSYELTTMMVSPGGTDNAGHGHAIINLHDITSRKRSEEMLRTYAQRLKESNQSLEEFAYVASHDLQEPLRKVQVFGERLNSKFGDSLGEGGKNYLGRMLNASSRMQRLIKGLLTYSRVTTTAEKFTTTDLNEIVREVVSDLEVRIEESHAHINIGHLPVIEADSLQVRQLFQNLIGNALKFQDEDARPRVDIQAEAEDHTDGARRWSITIQDNGIGFDDRHAESVFGVFNRLHSASSRYHGSGIGLAVCKKIVERHGGTISVASTQGEGTCFHILLPARQNSGDTALPSTGDPRPDSKRSTG